MKFSLTSDHFHHYRQRGYVEFEGIVNQAKLQVLLNAIRRERYDTAEQRFQKQHDLWRLSPAIKKILFHKDIASIVASLHDAKPLRIGYDQLIPEGYLSKRKSLSLREMSSLQGIIGGYLLCLQDCPGALVTQPLSEESERKIAAPFSTTAGNVVFIDPEVAIDYASLPCDHLLVCFTGATAIYCHNENDPHTHTFKKQGYVFGDKIQESELPTVLREFNL